jgi:transposase
MESKEARQSTQSVDRKNRTGAKASRPRRRHSEEFKQGAVKLVTEQGYNVSAAARSLGIDRGLLDAWMHKFAPDWRTDLSDPSDDPKVLALQLRAARKENERLRATCEILKKATAYFANPNP